MNVLTAWTVAITFLGSPGVPAHIEKLGWFNEAKPITCNLARGLYIDSLDADNVATAVCIPLNVPRNDDYDTELTTRIQALEGALSPLIDWTEALEKQLQPDSTMYQQLHPLNVKARQVLEQ